MKNIILAILFITHSFFMGAQVIKNPKFSASSDSSKIVQIDQVELTGENTIISFTVRQLKGSEIIIPSDVYIIPCEGGEKLYLQKAVGITINEPVKKSHGGKISFKLIFPRVESDVKKINYHDGISGNNWHFFEINIDIDPVDDAQDYLMVPEKGRILVDGIKWKYINNPSYTAKSDNTFRIARIELSDTETVLYFEITELFGDWVIIPKESYIQPSDGSEKLYIKSAEGTRKNIEDLSADSGPMRIKLYFPNVEENVKKINFKAIGNNGSWSVFELDINMD